MPKVTIGKIAGIARGGGSELLLSLDMRFAALETAVLGQPEVALGIIPGGSATQRLPQLVGRGRALEIILGCNDFSAELAERYGYINRAVPARELDAFVADLARRIATFPSHAIRLAKRAVAAAQPDPMHGLLEEAWCFNLTLGEPETRRRMRRFMDTGGQTREMELRLQDVFDAVGVDGPDKKH
jgi:enoyl-CoA hydratase/carnithine racemase